MTRWKLITSDEYVKAWADSFIVSNRSIKQMRKNAIQFITELRDELLKGDESTPSEQEIEKVLWEFWEFEKGTTGSRPDEYLTKHAFERLVKIIAGYKSSLTNTNQ